MNIFNKARISTAVDKLQPHSFNSRHITTADFFQLMPIYHREIVPKQKVNIDVRSFARLKDMPVPTFGEAKMSLRAFFVPMRTIYRGWDDFITDALHVNSGSQYATHDEEVPKITNVQLLDFFSKQELTYSVGTEDFYDIIVITGASTQSKKAFTPFGRQCYKILMALGYTVSMDKTVQVSYSALPLLSFLRAYLDWYYPSQYFGDTTSALLMSLCLRDTSQDASMNADRLLAIFKVICYVCYGEDYFTSAFDSPNGPTPASNVGASSIRLVDVNVPTDNLRGSNPFSIYNKQTDYYQNTPVATTEYTPEESESLQPSFSQYVIDALKSLTDFMKRHQLVGARAFERYAARFGLELPASKLNRSVYLGSHQLDLMVQDVMSTAETDGANLGSYAGKGIVAGSDGHFDYETDEYGYLMICMSITPDIAYHQGVDRKVKHLTKLDFFTPEFDALGTQAIGKDELFVPQTMEVQDTADFKNLHQGVFGFTPKYSEYKIPRNNLTGDFKCKSLSVGDTSSAWHLFRNFENGTFNSASDMVHDKAFVTAYPFPPQYAYPAEVPEAAQYNRIFYNTSITEDHFVCLFYFKERHYMPMKPLFDTYEFKDEDEHSSRIVDVNGVKMT